MISVCTYHNSDKEMRKLFNICVAAIPLVLIICSCFGCGKEKAMGDNTLADTTNGRLVTGLRYLALGDSYTIGQSVGESERFPAQTARLLATDNEVVESIKYIAVTGWTTTNLRNAISAQNPSPNFDVVTLLIGVNDQYQHKDTASYRTNFTHLLQTAVTLAGNRASRVFVLSIPDYSVTPFVPAYDKGRVSEEINAFNEINREITLANKITYIDITPASREAANDRSLIASDGLHPSGRQYAKWAGLLAPMIKSAVR